MAESSTPTPGGPPPAKDEVELLEILRLLIKSKKARSTADLLKYATQFGAPEAEERLRLLEAENVPLDLAFDAVSGNVALSVLACVRQSTALLNSTRLPASPAQWPPECRSSASSADAIAGRPMGRS